GGGKKGIYHRGTHGGGDRRRPPRAGAARLYDRRYWRRHDGGGGDRPGRDRILKIGARRRRRDGPSHHPAPEADLQYDGRRADGRGNQDYHWVGIPAEGGDGDAGERPRPGHG